MHMKPIMSVRSSLLVCSFGGVGLLQFSMGSSLLLEILMMGGQICLSLVLSSMMIMGSVT